MKQGKRSCSTCFFAEEVMMNNLQRQYVCHRFPPGHMLLAQQQGVVNVTAAAQMNAQQWCAEFWPKNARLLPPLWNDPGEIDTLPAMSPPSANDSPG